jgi:malate dehydrogenase
MNFAKTALMAATARFGKRSYSASTALNAKVAVLGAAGGIGQPLSLLCKLSPEFTSVSCYDVVNAPGVAADLSHIPTAGKVTGSLPGEGVFPAGAPEGLQGSLEGCDIVIIPAGVPRKPGMTRDDLFATNAGIVRTLMEGVAKWCPKALVCIISNPVNSTVPIAKDVMVKAGVYDPKKLAGVTYLDVCRANTFIGEKMGKQMADDVPVIGGHAGITILPLFSQVPGLTMTDEEREALTVRVQFGGDEVVQAKAGAGSATLSMAYAGFVFAEQAAKAMKGADVTMNAYVESDVTDAEFFASPCKFGPNGIEEVKGFGAMSDYEQGWFDKMLPDLKAQIAKGHKFME